MSTSSTSSTSSSGIFSNAQIAAFGNRMQIFGLGSQFDTQTLLNADLSLLTMEQTPYVNEENNDTSLKSDWTTFQSTVASIQSDVSDLENLSTEAKTVSLSDTGYIDATADGTALDGTYSVSVQQLATKQRVASDQQATGALGIDETDQLNGKDLKITSDMDLSGIATAINSGSYGVDAVVLNNQLVLTSQNTGTDNKIQFSGTAWNTLGVTQKGAVKNELQGAQDASFSVNGIPMTSDSNTFTGISGLTVNLDKATNGETIDLTVNRSADSVVSKVQTLVNDYNKVITTINSDTAQGASLSGQSVPRNLKTAMNNLLFSVTNNGTLLYQLGITLNPDTKDGTLSFDSSKLTDMYNSDPNTVTNMLTGTSGFAGQLHTIIDNYSRSGDGIIQGSIDGISKKITSVQDTLTKMQDQYNQQQQSLLTKYASFETQMSSLNMESQYLTSMLSGNSSSSN